MGSSLVEVALPLPVDRTYTYRIPAGSEDLAVPGRRVMVPFGRRGEIRGFVVGRPETSDYPKLKEVSVFLDDGPVLGPDILGLCRFISAYYGCSIGEALDAALPSGVKHGRAARNITHAALAIPPQAALDLAETLPDREAKQARILRLLAAEDRPIPLAPLLSKAKASRSPADTLVKKGLIKRMGVRLESDPLNEAAATRTEPPEPTGEQAAAIREIAGAVAGDLYQVFLLFGITGSGKTEVYLRAIEDCRQRGKQAIVLVPEIALTPQTVRRFRSRFDRVAVLHSAQSEAERRRWWKATQAGQVDVVVGPRSAVFAPVPDLGLIVVDEEHDTSFKQNRTPRYHARDVAVVRALEANAAVVLGSATPALESYQNAVTGKYRMLRLTARLGGGSLPPVEIVDMGREMMEVQRFTHFSRRLRALITESLGKKEQVMLFLNRRGFSTLLICRQCGESLNCRNCSVTLTYHQGHGRALCHMCGFERRVPDACPACAQPGLLHKGFGTEKVEAEISTLYPESRIARMDSDTMTTRDSYERVLEKVGNGEIDILVGTQMIAKGLHFRGITAVGVVDADTSLRLPDFRAGERTFQLIAQVAGRTGRGERGGRVVVQTFRPGQPALTAAAAHDYLAFATEELAQRKAFGYPPYGRILLAVVQGKKAASVQKRAQEVVTTLRAALDPKRATVLGPAIPPIDRVKDRFRRQVVVKARGVREIRRAVSLLRGQRTGGKSGVEVVLDVDPTGLM
jgi:primosomal protein N' (replication factor Y) (superfamily II helicase)